MQIPREVSWGIFLFCLHETGIASDTKASFEIHVFKNYEQCICPSIYTCMCHERFKIYYGFILTTRNHLQKGYVIIKYNMGCYTLNKANRGLFAQQFCDGICRYSLKDDAYGDLF